MKGGCHPQWWMLAFLFYILRNIQFHLKESCTKFRKKINVVMLEWISQALSTLISVSSIICDDLEWFCFLNIYLWQNN